MSLNNMDNLVIIAMKFIKSFIYLSINYLCHKTRCITCFSLYYTPIECTTQMTTIHIWFANICLFQCHYNSDCCSRKCSSFVELAAGVCKLKQLRYRKIKLKLVWKEDHKPVVFEIKLTFFNWEPLN